MGKYKDLCMEEWGVAQWYSLSSFYHGFESQLSAKLRTWEPNKRELYINMLKN